jgi:mono/diheme cytochrome c family protein
MRIVMKVLVVLVGLVVILASALYLVTNSRMAQTWAIEADEVAIPSDSASVAWGRHIARSRGCADCHREDMGGGLFLDAGPVATIYASNLTLGEGGVAGLYGDADWLRAIRHGVAYDGSGLLFMPSYEYYFMSDRDVASLVAYLKTLPPVDREISQSRVGPLGRFLYLQGQFPLLPVEMIDHEAVRPEPEPGPTAEYGAYLAVGCTGCHGTGFSGGKIPGVPPDWPPAANLTPDPETGIAGWSEADFMAALRDGVRPDGTAIQTDYMPVTATSRMLDYELQAIYAFLMSLEARPQGGR